jgi:hypothetical protein
MPELLTTGGDTALAVKDETDDSEPEDDNASASSGAVSSVGDSD